MEAVTGERIVAFGRTGKSPENPFSRHFPGPFEGEAEWRKAAAFCNAF
jgi:hypothetical protein